jgi:universal stress protein E
MARFRKILHVVTSARGHRAAFRRAVRLAQANRASLTLAECIADMPAEFYLASGALGGVDLDEYLRRDSARRLARLRSQAERELPRVSTVTLTGKPSIEVVRLAMKGHYDLVVVAAEASERGPWLGSDVLRILRKCPVPVWVEGPVSRARLRGVMAAVDPAHPDAARTRLDLRILDLASAVARQERARLHVVHAWDAPGASTLLRPMMGMTVPQYVAYVDQCRQRHQARLDALLRRIQGLPRNTKVHLEKGDAAEVIVRFARRLRPGLIVMGTVARTGLSAFLYGNTAEKILSQVACPVLAVKPRGFVSPVRL